MGLSPPDLAIANGSERARVKWVSSIFVQTNCQNVDSCAHNRAWLTVEHQRQKGRMTEADAAHGSPEDLPVPRVVLQFYLDRHAPFDGIAYFGDALARLWPGAARRTTCASMPGLSAAGRILGLCFGSASPVRTCCWA